LRKKEVTVTKLRRGIVKIRRREDETEELIRLARLHEEMETSAPLKVVGSDEENPPRGIG